VITGATTNDVLLRRTPPTGPWHWPRCVDPAGQTDADRRSARADRQRTPATPAVCGAATG